MTTLLTKILKIVGVLAVPQNNKVLMVHPNFCINQKTRTLGLEQKPPAARPPVVCLSGCGLSDHQLHQAAQASRSRM